ncbi:MAG TPA: hypothetical protein VLF62_01145 [Candidatus Saccharimonadales bacterium]|nr:hypothetical protein [Candidatus Saccharimonadales bacterium]
MSSREKRPGAGADDILATLTTAGIPMEPVALSRRIIVGHAEGHELAEFVSSEYGVRILAVPENGTDALWRARLADNAVPVPTKVGSESGIGLWLIPPGTHTLGDSAHLIAVHPEKYGRLLRMVGEAHRTAYDSGLGGIAPIEGVQLIDRFAFAPDVQSPDGIGVFLLPPYNFDPSARRDDFAHGIVDELSQLPGLFQQKQLLALGQQLQEGGGGI